MTAGSGSDAIVAVIDGDPGARKSVARLLRAAGFVAAAYASAEDYLDQADASAAGCLVLDVTLPGLSGLELQVALSRSGQTPSIVFLTGEADVADSVQAMKHGAAEFFTKPVDDTTLIEAVREAIETDRAARESRTALDGIRSLLGTLTPRESEVLGHVVAGRRNKQIAAELGTAEKTVKLHRARVMEKMQARSLVELVRRAAAVGFGHAAAGGPTFSTRGAAD